jgi:RNA polymerase-binding transcription factor DksA
MSHLTEEFIQKQKERLLNEKAKIEKEITTLKKDDPFSDPDHANDNAAVDNDVREQDWHQNIEAQINDMEKRLSDIKLALTKIEKGRYGICEKTNRPIPESRLELVPEARFLVNPS